MYFGASGKPGRFSLLAIKSLVKHGFEVVAIGARQDVVEGIPIVDYPVHQTDIHTVTLYLNRFNQKEYLDYIVSLNPKRIIFNPGTENPELFKLAKQNGIEVFFDCALVLLTTGQY